MDEEDVLEEKDATREEVLRKVLSGSSSLASLVEEAGYRGEYWTIDYLEEHYGFVEALIRSVRERDL